MNMSISIFGLGYVGAVSAACLANAGHHVIGVDPNGQKVNDINEGRSPIIEEGLAELICKNRDAGRLTATTEGLQAFQQTSMSLICVGTPSQANGSLDYSYVEKVCEEIGSALKTTDSYHTIVIRSTILPGSLRDLVIPTLESHSGLVAGKDFGICNNPEFLREGTAIYDYNHPPKTVIGEIDTRAGDIVESMYTDLDAPLIRCTLEVAEMVKYVDNSWHALKVAFANEVGSICKALHLDSHQVMDIFCKDEKLNLSPYYLKPGFAFGGSCLPKDVRALNYRSTQLDLDLPLLRSVLPSNRAHLARCKRMIDSLPDKRIGVLGLSFKAGTDDLRESPMVEVIEYLIGKGYDIKIYDENVRLASLTGANKNYILNVVPHIGRLLVAQISDVLEHASTILIGNANAAHSSIFEQLKPHQRVIDFVRLDSRTTDGNNYFGVAW